VGLGQDVEQVGREHVAPDDRQVGRRLLGPRLLDEVADLPHVATDVAARDHAVLVDPLAGHPLDGNDGSGVLVEDVEELAHARHRGAADDVVAEEDAERLVAHQRAGDQDGVAEAERLLLAHVTDRGQLGDRLDLGQLLHLAAIVQVVLELEGGVEVVLDRPLVASGDDDDLRQAGGDRLLDHVLDRRLVDQRQHLLGLGLGGGQEPCAEPGGGKDGFAYAHGGSYPAVAAAAASMIPGTRARSSPARASLSVRECIV
jgi:hypothetical protein